PPGWSEYTFGTWTPWWIGGADDMEPPSPAGGIAPRVPERSYDEAMGGEPDGTGRRGNVRTLAGRTDVNGKHRTHLRFLSVSSSQPTALSAQATVQDVNRQAWTARTTMLVHPASLYVGLKPDRFFVQQGERMPVRVVVTDLDGKAVASRAVHLRLTRLEYAWESGTVEEIAVDAHDHRSGDTPVVDELVPPEGGEYRLVAEIEDDKGRRNRSEITFWVPGGKQIPAREVTREKVTLVPDRKEHAVGDTAHVLVSAPFPAGKALLTVRRGDIVETRVINLENGSGTFDLPITESMIPNVFVQVDVVGEAVRTDDAGKPDERLPKRAAFASGRLDLSVPPVSRTLSVKADPKHPRLDPGGKTDVEVDVRDATGSPVANSQVAVVVVDESVLALTRYKIPNPLTIFYPHRQDDTTDSENRTYVRLDDPTRIGGDGGKALSLEQDKMGQPAPGA
ncbi:MAG: hypothetical protein EB084_25610, partial [Proteobacteria bacterium]|nr:hypothetical protein [Pseudomonadota bacterium]